MHRKTVSAPRPFDARAEAGELLAKDGNRLLLIEALAVLLTLTLLYVGLSAAYESVAALTVESFPLTAVTLGYVLLTLAVTLLFTLPSVFGFFRMCCHIGQGQTPMLAELFAPFGNRALYSRILALSYGWLWRLVVLLCVIAATCHASSALFDARPLPGVLCGIAVPFEILLGVLWLFRCFSVTSVVIGKEMPLAAAKKAARAASRLCPTGGIRFLLSMIPHLLLGLLTFGIFLIWEVLPRMCIAYFLYCNQIHEKIVQSEET